MALTWTATDRWGADYEDTATLRPVTHNDNARADIAGVLEIAPNTVRLTVAELRELATVATMLADQKEK